MTNNSPKEFVTKLNNPYGVISLAWLVLEAPFGIWFSSTDSDQYKLYAGIIMGLIFVSFLFTIIAIHKAENHSTVKSGEKGAIGVPANEIANCEKYHPEDESPIKEYLSSIVLHNGNNLDKEFMQTLQKYVAHWTGKYNRDTKYGTYANIAWTTIFKVYVEDKEANPNRITSLVSLYPKITFNICDFFCDYFHDKRNEKLQVDFVSPLLPYFYYNFPHHNSSLRKTVFYCEEFVDRYRKRVKKILREKNNWIGIQLY